MYMMCSIDHEIMGTDEMFIKYVVLNQTVRILGNRCAVSGVLNLQTTSCENS